MSCASIKADRVEVEVVVDGVEELFVVPVDFLSFWYIP